MGWVKPNAVPGSAARRSFSNRPTSASRSFAVFHSARGFRITKTSLCSMPMTSVATSGLPVRDTTRTTSG